ncbi:hypothetical protein ICN28_06220 [Polynucleobacter sp. 30F-ANTBAC]|uniref:hypothetical protein n=1 Tax=Polynucleobacter sp. 30F-ANTBAC TaxID=2689095 RepID=UPI001C0DF2F6|nr:hypothetical protein [Polynucleobacter sp. 30F-ANTBAC]MBU3600108.1 hypothetical protein [Polynucleobacter sp. 30F-ANTBAC]
MEFIEKLPNWFRWILVPISSLLTFVLVSLMAVLAIWIETKLLGIGEGAWLDKIWVNVIAAVLTGYSTIFVGALFAPSFKKIVALVLGGIVVLATGLILGSLIQKGDWWGLINVISNIIGVGGAIYTVFEDSSTQKGL